MSKSTIHRNSSSLHIEKLHKKQLMLQLEDEYKQSSSLHISRRLSKEIENKLEVSQCVRDVMLKSCKKIKEDFNKSRFQSTHQSKSKKILELRFGRKGEGLKKFQNKLINFKNRNLMQQYERTKVERKLNQIVFIKNQGHIEKEDNFIYSRVAHQPKREKQQIIFGDNQVVNRYWNELQRGSKLSRQSLIKIKENRVNMLIRQNIGPDQDIQQINEIKAKLNRKLIEKNDDLRKSLDCLCKPSFLKKKNNRHTNYSSLDTSTDALDVEESNRYVVEEPKKYLLTKQILENSFIDYLKHKKQRKLFLNRLNKELIEREDAVKIYNFVKGGYNLDPYDIQGEFISLRRFNEAKQSFSTLNELYKSIKSDCFYGKSSDSNKPRIERSFKSVVYINQLNGKVAPNQLLKLMKQKKIVK